MLEGKSTCMPSYMAANTNQVKHHALISDFKNGGLRMLDIESLIKTKWVMC